MAINNKTEIRYSFPILGLLGLMFIGLKLAEIGVVATWSWLWVLAPFWVLPAGLLALAAVLLVLAIIAAGIQALIK